MTAWLRLSRLRTEILQLDEHTVRNTRRRLFFIFLTCLLEVRHLTDLHHLRKRHYRQLVESLHLRLSLELLIQCSTTHFVYLLEHIGVHLQNILIILLPSTNTTTNYLLNLASQSTPNLTTGLRLMNLIFKGSQFLHSLLHRTVLLFLLLASTTFIIFQLHLLTLELFLAISIKRKHKISTGIVIVHIPPGYQKRLLRHLLFNLVFMIDHLHLLINRRRLRRLVASTQHPVKELFVIQFVPLSYLPSFI